MWASDTSILRSLIALRMNEIKRLRPTTHLQTLAKARLVVVWIGTVKKPSLPIELKALLSYRLLVRFENLHSFIS